MRNASGLKRWLRSVFASLCLAALTTTFFSVRAYAIGPCLNDPTLKPLYFRLNGPGDPPYYNPGGFNLNDPFFWLRFIIGPQRSDVVLVPECRDCADCTPTPEAQLPPRELLVEVPDCLDCGEDCTPISGEGRTPISEDSLHRCRVEN